MKEKPDEKYLVIDRSDPYEKGIYKFASKEQMLDRISDMDIGDMDDLEVYEIAKKIKLVKKPAIIDIDCD